MAKAPAASADPAFTGDEKIVVLTGKDEFLRTHYLQQLRRALEGRGEVETIRFDGDSAALSAVLDEARSFGLMQQHKLIVVDEAEEFVKKFREPLERYAERPEDAATLLLRSGKWNKGNLDKLIAKVGAVVECAELDDRAAPQWVVRHGRESHGVTITARAASLLVEHMGADRGLLDSEVGKIAAGLPADKPTIDVPQVEALVGRASEEAAWEIQEAMLSRNPARAIAKLHELVDLAGQPKELVTYFVADLVRKLHHASAMLQRGKGPMEVARMSGVWGDRQRPFMEAASKLSTRRAARLLEELVEMDSRSKSGFGDALRGLESFCVRFAAALG